MDKLTEYKQTLDQLMMICDKLDNQCKIIERAQKKLIDKNNSFNKEVNKQTKNELHGPLKESKKLSGHIDHVNQEVPIHCDYDDLFFNQERKDLSFLSSCDEIITTYHNAIKQLHDLDGKLQKIETLDQLKKDIPVPELLKEFQSSETDLKNRYKKTERKVADIKHSENDFKQLIQEFNQKVEKTLDTADKPRYDSSS